MRLIIKENRKIGIENTEDYLTPKEFDLLYSYSNGATRTWDSNKIENRYYNIDSNGYNRIFITEDIKGFIEYFTKCIDDEAINIIPSKKKYELSETDKKYILNLLGKISLNYIKMTERIII